MPSDKRGRNWAFIIYPDSWPENYVQILDEKHLAWCESPIHDADINANGDEKKHHKHIFVAWMGKKSYEQVLEISKEVNGTIPILVENARGMVRYFCHIDNPEKAQYQPEEIICHGGLDISDYFKLGQSATRKMIKEIVGFIEYQNINTFKDLVSICYRNDYDEWLDCITQKNTMFFSAYMRDRFYIWKLQQENNKE